MPWIYGTTEDDVIYGIDGLQEPEHNILIGLAGNDRLIGGNDCYFNQLFGEDVYVWAGIGGDDVLIAGNAVEWNNVFGDAGYLYGDAVGGNDILIGGEHCGRNLLTGDGSYMWDSARGGNDTITGGEYSTNVLAGDGGSMGGGTRGGNDTLIGGAHSQNQLFGEGYFVLYDVICGDDTLVGGADSVNYLYGEARDGMASSIAGNDRLVSGTGTDHMWGESGGTVTDTITGADVFAFSQNNGNDFIYDFERGKDVIEVSMPDEYLVPMTAAAIARLPFQHMSAKALARIVHEYDFSDLAIEVVDGNSVVHFDGSNSVTVFGVTGLTVDDFMFV